MPSNLGKGEALTNTELHLGEIFGRNSVCFEKFLSSPHGKMQAKTKTSLFFFLNIFLNKVNILIQQHCKKGARISRMSTSKLQNKYKTISNEYIFDKLIISLTPHAKETSNKFTSCPNNQPVSCCYVVCLFNSFFFVFLFCFFPPLQIAGGGPSLHSTDFQISVCRRMCHFQTHDLLLYSRTILQT